MSSYDVLKKDICLDVLPEDIIIGTKREKKRNKCIFFWILSFTQIIFIGAFILFLSYIYKYDIAIEMSIKYFVYITIINSYFYIKNINEDIVAITLIRYTFMAIINFFVIFFDYKLSFLINTGSNLYPETHFTSTKVSIFLPFFLWLSLCNVYFYSKEIKKYINIRKTSTFIFCVLYTLETFIMLEMKVLDVLGLIDRSNTYLIVSFLIIILSKLVFIMFDVIDNCKLKSIIVPVIFICLYFWDIYKMAFLEWKSWINSNK
ncbi:hypothetical protein CWI36_0045p0040 [Hamiltosporidium magnivora]|uniref:Uncharacterized protein n=1 Tax=Hamiltosporidium magnivora TaxID=148818 RepID=A0A4Q9LMB1_9MICR|nr:hypothetical protein CWI36_0045p0040 [Hamiltosporidium magnivora]